MLMFRSSTPKWVLACVALGVGAIPAAATALLQLSVEQMTAAATEIVQGTVTGTYTAPSGNTIFTHYSIQVSKRLKGSDGATTDVAVPGGEYKGLRQTFPGVPVLQTGDEYLLFLWQGSKGPNQLVGLNQGVLAVTSSGSGLMMVSRRATGETMFSQTGKAVADHPVAMKLTDAHARISAALKNPAGAPPKRSAK